MPSPRMTREEYLAFERKSQEKEDVKNDTLLNPTLIVEVLSETTEAYDRGKKFEHYRRIESLQEYLLIPQDQYKVEQFVKQKDETWIFSEITDR